MPETVERTAPPLQITLADWREALRSVGISTRGLLSVESDPFSVTLVYRRMDVDGRSVAAGKELATETYVVGIARPEMDRSINMTGLMPRTDPEPTLS